MFGGWSNCWWGLGGVVAANKGEKGWGIVGSVVLGALVGIAAGALVASSGMAIYIGCKGSAMSATMFLSLKRSTALGIAIYNIIGLTVGPLLSIDWPLIEWGQPTSDNLPTENPYSTTYVMGFNSFNGRKSINKYNARGHYA